MLQGRKTKSKTWDSENYLQKDLPAQELVP